MYVYLHDPLDVSEKNDTFLCLQCNNTAKQIILRKELYLPDLVAPKMISAKILKTFLETHHLEILLSSNATLTKDMSLGWAKSHWNLVFLADFLFLYRKRTSFGYFSNSLSSLVVAKYHQFHEISLPVWATKASLFEWCSDRSEVYSNGVFQYVHEVWTDRSGFIRHSMKRTKTPLKIDQKNPKGKDRIPNHHCLGNDW